MAHIQKQISDIIRQISQNAASEIMKLANKNVTIVNQAENMIKNLAPEISQTAKLVDNITKASQEQNTSIHQINDGALVPPKSYLPPPHVSRNTPRS